MADTFRDEVCGRVLAMLARSSDASQKHAEELARAVGIPTEAPLVIPKPTIRIDICVVMLLVGVLITMVFYNMSNSDFDDDSYVSSEDHERANRTTP